MGHLKYLRCIAGYYYFVKRVFSSVRSIVNFSIKEKGLSCSNAFSGTFFPEETDSKIRKSIPNSHLKKVHKLCLQEDDEVRWAIGLVGDTGMRLGEAVGLLKSDIILDAKIPYIDLKPHHWGVYFVHWRQFNDNPELF